MTVHLDDISLIDEPFVTKLDMVRWEDNFREWTGLEFAKFQKAVENRGKFRKLVAKSSVVPQRPLRLRDLDDDDD